MEIPSWNKFLAKFYKKTVKFFQILIPTWNLHDMIVWWNLILIPNWNLPEMISWWNLILIPNWNQN